MANKLRIKLTDKEGTFLFIPSSGGQIFTIKQTFESSTISLSTLATGLATITLEGYAGSVGFYRGIVVTFKNKADSVWNTTMIGSRGFDLSDEEPGPGWVIIESIRCYVYADALTVNASWEFDKIPI